MKCLKVTISGSYKAENGDTIDYDKLTGFLPLVSEAKAHQQLSGRIAMMWIMQNKERFPARLSHMRETYLDTMEVVSAPKDVFTFIGKDIFDMSYEELQDLSVAKDLLEIPLYKNGSLREAREAAYRAYSKHVLGRELKKDFKFTNVSAIRPDSTVREGNHETISNEEILDAESESQSEMSYEDLRRVAKGMGMEIKGKPSREELINIIQGKQAA